MDTTFPLRSPFAQLDPRFLLILFASIATHMLVAAWVARQPAAPQETELDQPLDRFAPLHPIPKFKPQPRPAPLPVHVAPAVPTPSGSHGSAPEGNLLSMVSRGFGDLLNGDERAAIDGAHFSNVDTSLLAQQRRDGTSQIQQIAPLTTGGVKQVGIGERAAQRDPAPMLPDIDTQDFKDLPDPAAIAHYVNAHRKALAYCYEAELKRHSDLRGRVTLRFDIGALGRAEDVSIVDDTLQSPALETCLLAAVRRWVLPVREGGPVQFPILFTPAQ